MKGNCSLVHTKSNNTSHWPSTREEFLSFPSHRTKIKYSGDSEYATLGKRVSASWHTIFHSINGRAMYDSSFCFEIGTWRDVNGNDHISFGNEGKTRNAMMRKMNNREERTIKEILRDRFVRNSSETLTLSRQIFVGFAGGRVYKFLKLASG